MNRMSAPKMETVRFNEADVIVASGYGQKMEVDGFGNNSGGDGYFLFGTKRYTTSDINGEPNHFKGEFDAAFPGGSEISDPLSIPFGSSTLGGLISAETANDDPEANKQYNGTYIWNGSGFTKKQ